MSAAAKSTVQGKTIRVFFDDRETRCGVPEILLHRGVDAVQQCLAASESEKTDAMRRGSRQETREPRSGGKRAPSNHEYDDSAAVTAYLASLEHPLKAVVVSVRSTILGVDPAITEGIKWSSASFYCHGWFATVNVRARDALQVVLHHGAKARADATLGQSIDDTAGMLKWMSADRAVITFTSLDDLEVRRGAFAAIIRQWVAHQMKLTNLA